MSFTTGSDWGNFDIDAARRTYRRREAERTERLRQLWRDASDQADRAVALIAREFAPTRIIQWGSILRPERFTEISDIDIAVEGIDDQETWSRLEREVERIVSFPLDLLPFGLLRPEYRREILQRGKVVYEQQR